MRWINVNEELPEDHREVLLFAINDDGIKEIIMGCLDRGTWFHCCLFDVSTKLRNVTITHWSELLDYPELDE
jgi:hypothetical protein